MAKFRISTTPYEKTPYAVEWEFTCLFISEWYLHSYHKTLKSAEICAKNLSHIDRFKSTILQTYN